MNDYIAKPIEVGTLFGVLARWLSKPGTVPAAVPAPPGEAPVPAAPAAAPAHPLAGLAGVDLAAGHAATAGNDALYRRLLTRFRDSQRSFGPQFRQAQVADPARARRLAHDLRGVAGTLGMPVVSQAAGALELAIEDGMDTEPALAEVLQALAPVIEQLDLVPLDA
jgi:HPt (histidine-containing phosphotransfer) domain-containing protein